MFLALVINSAVIAVVVSIHYEALRILSVFLPKIRVPARMKVLVAVFGCLVAHAVEVWFFAIALYLQIQQGDFGYLQGNLDGTFYDSVYFSFTSYTSLGYGDIEPIGHIRFHAGLESLVGLVMIGWTASFLYLEMASYWRR